jgi:hypothetical protein
MTKKLVERLREISESLLCHGGVGHYCPNCDNTTFDAAMSLKMLADQLGTADETNEAQDARRYSILRDYIEPRTLYDKLVRSGKSPGEWVNLGKQTIRQKIDELCDGQLK